jgi:alpha-tubulin suppressor-like RCC1 family protein
VDEGYQFTCGVTTADLAYCWGHNGVGQLGDGTGVNRHVPTLVAGGLHWRHVTAGVAHGCGLTTENRVYCWGYNFKGEVGDSTTSRRYSPVPIYGGRRWLQVRAGNMHTCAITTGSVTYCWGQNLFGELGIGTLAYKRRLIPNKVVGGIEFASISGRNFHVCGLTAGGKAYCWGNNEYGRLGDGTTTLRTSPRAVAGTRLYQTINAGGQHTCALGTNGRIYCWGRNDNGQLGDGGTADHLTPKPIAVTLPFVGVSTSRGNSSCAVTTAGVGYCWGDNELGQLGDGTVTDRLIPAAVAGSHVWRGIVPGALHSCGVLQGSNAGYCWGVNDDGQLGDGTQEQRLVPTPVAPPL